MADVFDLDPLDKFMAMFVGPSGSGKSVAIASWLKKGSIYSFDFDGRMNTVSAWYKARGLKKGQLTYDTYGPENLYQALVKMNEFISYCPHAAISIDSFTAVTVSAVMYSLRQRQGKSGNDVPSMSKGNLIVPDWDEYKGETVYVTTLLDMCKAIAAKGIAVFWTAHPITSTKIEKGTAPGEKDNYGKQTRYAAYGNKADSLLPIYFNELYHFTTRWDFATDSAARICFTAPYGDITAKTALGLPPQIDWTARGPQDPTFYEILTSLVQVPENPKEETENVKEEKKEEKGDEFIFTL